MAPQVDAPPKLGPPEMPIWLGWFVVFFIWLPMVVVGTIAGVIWGSFASGFMVGAAVAEEGIEDWAARVKARLGHK